MRTKQRKFIEEEHPMVRAFELLVSLPDDMFTATRKDGPPQRRAFITFSVPGKRAAKKGFRK